MIDAANREFGESGYAGATTAAIARRADITEAQLFRYYPSKSTLFHEAVFKPLNEHFQKFNEQAFAGSQGDTDLEIANNYISELSAFLKQHSRPLMALMIAQAYAPISPAMSPDQAGLDSLTRYFERGAQLLDNGLGKAATVDLRLMVRISFAAVLACVLMDDWLFPPGLGDGAAVEQAIHAFVINGITPAPSAEQPRQASGETARPRKRAAIRPGGATPVKSGR